MSLLAFNGPLPLAISENLEVFVVTATTNTAAAADATTTNNKDFKFHGAANEFSTSAIPEYNY
jgi:hypothetical protein